MKALKANLHSFRNEEYFQFHTEIRGLVNRYGAETLKIKPQFDVYVATHGDMDEALKKILKSPLTMQIHELDDARDLVYRGMVEAVVSAGHHFNEKVRLPAYRIRIAIDTYGNVAKKTTDSESAAIYNLTKDLSTKYADDVEAIGIGAWITELDRLNGALAKLMTERYDEVAGRTGLVMSEVRVRLDEAYRAIVLCVEALLMMSGGGADGKVYADFIGHLNAVVERNNSIIAQRRGRHAAAKND